jgi:serine/threonine protein kinase
MSEPVAGYTIRQRIGCGGYGEVWKADAPGGLSKAIKFVYGQWDDERAGCEMKALQRIKEVRHPFLLSLERIEIVDGQLVIVTELADMSLKDRFHECRRAGMPGIPRGELLVYLRDAADALDFMSDHHGLQHLDVKPENLLIVGGRVKVADFGLVRDVAHQTVTMLGGLTPVYAAPESFEGHPSRHSDQYSLAIVYQEMLTGVLPFPGKTAVQLTAQHLHSRPQLGPLPPGDRDNVARALAKDPAERFPTCRAMIEGLLAAGAPETEAAAPPDQRGEDLPEVTRDSATIVSPVMPRASGPPADSQQVRSWGGVRPPSVATLAREETVPGVEAPAEPAPDTPRSVTTTACRQSQAVLQWLGASRPEPEARAPPEAQAQDLPPLEGTAQKARLRPTLYVGLGGTAAWTLRRLHQRLCQRLGSLAAVPAIDLLLIDTDLAALAWATQGSQELALAQRQTLGIPLRSPKDYREGSERLLHWLSRRWLYNIPRSLQTEGVRALGRLALVDHAQAVFDGLRSALASIAAPESVSASLAAMGLDQAESAPRIVLISSISGGTGSGMVLDVAYAAREILAEVGGPGAELHGVLAHSTVRNPSAKDLALANACACLAELNHYATAGYAPDPACGLHARQRAGPPIDECYLVHLGDDLSEEELAAATGALAEYLYLDAVTAAGRFFDACRQSVSVGSGSSPHEMRLRTVGLGQVGFAQSELPAAAAEILAASLVQRWCGNGVGCEDHAVPAASPHADSHGAAEDHPLQLNLEQFVKRVQGLADALLGNDPETCFRLAYERLANPPEGPCAEGDRGPSAGAVHDLVSTLLGDRGDPVELSTSGANRLQNALGLQLKDFAGRQGAALCDWLYDMVDGSDSRVEGGYLAAQWLAERLRAVEAEADLAQKHCVVRLGQMEQSLLESDHVERARSRGWLGLGRAARRAPALDDRWIDYFRLRVEHIVLRSTSALARTLRARVAAVSDELADLRRRLYILADQFKATPFWKETDSGEISLADASSDPHEAVAVMLHRRLPDLAVELDRQFRTTLLAQHGGLRRLLADEGSVHGRIPAQLRAAARAAVLEALKHFDLAASFFPGVEQAQHPVPALSAWLQAAAPRLPACGGGRRLLLVCPEGSGQGSLDRIVQQAAGVTPSVVFDSDVSLVLCWETQEIALPRAAAALVAGRLDCVQIASRLHTRIDVHWTPLPLA